MKGTQTKRTKAAESRPGKSSVETNQSWEDVADWYDSLVGDEGPRLYQEVITPGVLRLLEMDKHNKVLDMACGQGVISRALCRAGAQVTGVDLSQRLIEMARKRSPGDIRYLVGDARHLDFFYEASFDAIVSILAAQNIEPIEPVFVECARLLRPLGRLVMVITHPAFRIPRQSSWRWDEERKLVSRQMDRYLSPLSIPIDMKPFREPGQTTTRTYHRPLQAYVNGLATAGLWVNALEEWASPKRSLSGPKARAENRARAEFPLFLALRAVRMAPLQIPKTH